MSAHQCLPAEPGNAFCHVCGTCGSMIEPVFCMVCEGTGNNPAVVLFLKDCPHCSGTGVIEWRPATLDLRWPDPKKGRP
jgi:DnaJ-class molecular chaperone